MKFKASLDKTAIIISSIISILLGLSILYKFNLPITFMLLTIYLICWYLKPLSFDINEDEIIIRRWFKSVHINKSEIESLDLIEKNRIRGSIRTFGVGGLFGWYGKFNNDELGSMTWYLTRRDRPILITTKSGKKILLSPDDTEGFLKEFHSSKQ